MLYLTSSNKYDIFETFLLLELQMEDLVPIFCNMAMVTNGDLNLHGFARQMLIRNEILTILAFKRCMNCLRPPAPDIVFDGLKYMTRFRVSRHQRLWRTSAGLPPLQALLKHGGRCDPGEEQCHVMSGFSCDHIVAVNHLYEVIGSPLFMPYGFSHIGK